MKAVKFIGVAALVASLGACAGTRTSDKSFDTNFGAVRKDMSQLVAGIWVDPNGCQHWIIDDGMEGYLSERLTAKGLPVCGGSQAPTTVTGPFKSGGDYIDPVRESDYAPSGREVKQVN